MTPANRAWWTERRLFTLLSLVAAWLFFAEYLPPLRRVHFIWDIEGYHYPLLSYAFKSLRAGRFPEWDTGIYCGISFAGNIQAGLFYPPNWLLFAANWSRAGLSFMSLQVLVALHYWIALLLTFLWLRDRGLRRLAAICGASSFAFSGFLLNEVQHLGATCGVVWFPLAFWGIDQAARSRTWRPLWKVAVASALCFLAGFPFIWVVLCTCVLVYALSLKERRWLAPAGAAALAASLLVAMVQVLPAAEAASMKVHWESFGGGLPRLQDYFTLFMPNYFDNARHLPPGIDEPYLYLGAPALFALGWWLRRGCLRAAAPALILVGACHLIMLNPFGAVAALLRRLPPLDQMVREWNFLACLPLAAAFLVGVAVDDFLSRRASPARPSVTPLALLLASGWSARQLVVWAGGGRAFLSGWASLAETAAVLVCFSLGLLALRAEVRPGRRAALLAVLLLLVWSDLKVYGTSRRFNAGDGNLDRMYAADARFGGPDYIGMERSVYARLRGAPAFRVVMNENPTIPDIRHYGLTSPQGADPMLPARYRQELEGAVTFGAWRTFIMDPARESVLQRFGVGYVITIRGSPYYQALLDRPRFRLLGSSETFAAVFEFLDALPAYGWPAGTVTCTSWIPERREFLLDSASGGDFVLLEQFYPGWHAFLDGRPVQIRPFSHAFQQVPVPAGAHTLRFQYRARGLRAGALISLASCFLLLLAVWPWQAGSGTPRTSAARSGRQ